MEIRDFLAQKQLPLELEPKLLQMMKLSLEWNEKINVTAIKEEDKFIELNLIDSLTFCGQPEIEKAKRIMDLGTGGGFPGLPLALVYPDKKFVLMDSVGKKLTVVQAIADELGLANVETIHARAEDLARDAKYREGFDLVTSRAVAALPALSEYCLPFVKQGGAFVAYKTETAMEEIQSAAKAIRILGGADAKLLPNGIEGSGHNFVIICKEKQTPKEYPRKAGLPTKQPL